MKSFTLTALLSVALIGSSSFATTVNTIGKKTDHCNFIPKNNLNIPEGMELNGGIDKKTFLKVIDNVSSFYIPIIKARGGELKVNRLWTDGTVNASAERDGNTWILNMYGGLARHPVTTEDGFSLVMCHEMGHQLGGFPKFQDKSDGSEWAANEGQADYFATMKCFRRVFQNADNASVVAKMNVPQIVKVQCANTFKSTAEIALCERESMAGNTLALLLWTLANSDNVTSAKPAFDTPDTSVVDTTNDAHPAAQCRLDTYFNGSICGASYTEDFGQNDPSTGSCAMEKGDQLGVRPLCWYKPQN